MAQSHVIGTVACIITTSVCLQVHLKNEISHNFILDTIWLPLLCTLRGCLQYSCSEFCLYFYITVTAVVRIFIMLSAPVRWCLLYTSETWTVCSIICCCRSWNLTCYEFLIATSHLGKNWQWIFHCMIDDVLDLQFVLMVGICVWELSELLC